jgi:hypothetical protein
VTYVVRRPNLGALATPAVVVAFMVLAPRAIGLHGFPWAIVALFAAASVWQAWRSTLALRVDGQGVLLRRRTPRRDQRDSAFVPWPSIHELVLTESDPPEFAVRLKTGAPLPAGVHGVIHDPRRPSTSAPELRVPLPRADRGALTTAVQGRVPVRSA